MRLIPVGAGGIRSTPMNSAPLTLVVFLAASAATAQSPSHSWHFFGVTQDGTSLFYSSTDLHGLPDGHVEVWTKGLSSKAVRREGDRLIKDKDVLKRVTMSALVGAPPITSVEKLSQDQIDEIALEEEVANEAQLKPVLRMLWEVDCAGKMMRTLSTYLVKGGRTGFSDKATEWGHVPPESTGETLYTLVCGKR